MRKSPPRINNINFLGRHAGMMEGLWGNCKHARVPSTLNVLTVTYIWYSEDMKVTESHGAYGAGEGTLTNTRLRHISGNLARLLNHRSQVWHGKMVYKTANRKAQFTDMTSKARTWLVSQPRVSELETRPCRIWCKMATVGLSASKPPTLWYRVFVV